MSRRQEVTDYICKQMDAVIPGDKSNSEMMRKYLDSLSEVSFKEYIRTLAPATTNEQKRKRNLLPFYRPNLSKNKVNIAHLYRLCEKMGRPLEQRLIMTDPVTGLQYLTPHYYPCYDCNVGRQSQTISKKRSIPQRTQRIENLTGQPTSTSKGSRISSPEAKGLGSRGLVKTLIELAHVRGGSVESYREFRRNISETGQCTLNQVSGLARAKSTMTLASYLTACHIGNNINPDTPVPPEVFNDRGVR